MFRRHQPHAHPPASTSTYNTLPHHPSPSVDILNSKKQESDMIPRKAALVIPLILWASICMILSPNYAPARTKRAPATEPSSTHQALIGSLKQPGFTNQTTGPTNKHESINLYEPKGPTTPHPGDTDNTTTTLEILRMPLKLRDLKPPSAWDQKFKIPASNEWRNTGNPTHHLNSKGGTIHSYIVCIVVHYLTMYTPSSLTAMRVMVMSLILPVTTSQSLVGYDTAGRFSPKKIVMKTVSLLGVETCDRTQTQSYLEPVSHQIQIIYRPTDAVITMLQCNIMITTELLHCESSIIRSDLYPAEYIAKDKVISVSAEECRKMFATKSHTLELFDSKIKINGISHSKDTNTQLIVGSRSANGGCKGDRINLGSTTRDNVVVRITISHFVKELKGRYSLDSNLIVVNDLVSLHAGGSSDISCDHAYGCFYPLDPQGLPTDQCESTIEFIKGPALVYRPNTGSSQTHKGYSDIIQISSDTDATQGTTLTLGDDTIICQTLVRRTNVPRLYVNILDSGNKHEISHRLTNSSGKEQSQYRMIDVLTASSNIYLRGTLSISEQFDKVSLRLCELRRAALLAILRDLLTSGPASLLNYREGILFRRIGSVAYIFLGVPVSARLRPTSDCFNEIPVTLETDTGEHDAFLTSKGRIIVSNGTRVLCGDRTAMHFLRDEPDEMARLNRSLDRFPDLAFSSEINEHHMKGSWLCQHPDMFIPCEPPSSLSPSLHGNADGMHFLGIKGRFMQQSIFGAKGREELYRAQTEGYTQQVIWTTITHNSESGMSSSAGDILVNGLSETARRHIRMIVLPTMFFVFGDLLTYVHQFILIMFLLNFLYRLGTMIGRVCMVYRKCGLSRYMVYAVFEGVYNAIIPWRSASLRNKQIMNELNDKVDTLRLNLDARANAHAIEIRALILEPPKLSLAQSPTTILRQKTNLYPQMRSIPMEPLTPYEDYVPNAPTHLEGKN